MVEQNLFQHEEKILTQAKAFLACFSQQETQFFNEYEKLYKAYEKLLRQTKLLIRISDKQQNHLTALTEGLQTSNIELQQKAEEVIKISEQRLAQFLEAIPVGVFVLTAEGKPYYANQKAQTILGQGIIPTADCEELPEIYQAYLAGTQQPYPSDKQPIVRALCNQESAYADDMEIHQADKVIPIEVLGIPIFDEQGQITYAVATFQDITERKQAEENRIYLAQEQEAKTAALRYSQDIEIKNRELSATLETLKTTQKQLIEAEKMAALGNLVAGVAHEINTPIGLGVTGASQLTLLTGKLFKKFESNTMKRSDLQRYLRESNQITNLINKNLNRAAELIKSFKQVAVDQTGEYERTFNLKHYLKEIIISLQPKLKQTPHQVTIEGDDDIVLFSYPGVFYQIITNLVINSLIHAFTSYKTGHIFLNVTKNPEQTQLNLRYHDDGKGISAADLPKIFDPFFTTNRQQGGNGLGLHIVYNLVIHKLKGTIACQSTPNQGVIFTLTMPINEDAIT